MGMVSRIMAIASMNIPNTRCMSRMRPMMTKAGTAKEDRNSASSKGSRQTATSRPHLNTHVHRHHVERGEHDSGNNPGHEQCTYGLLRGQPVQDKDHAGRYQYGQSPGGGDAGGGEGVGVLELTHLGQGDAPDGGAGGGTGTADRTE